MEKGSASIGIHMDDYQPRMTMQQSEGPEHTKATMIRTEKYKYVKRLYECDEFYALDDDSTERVNLIHDKRYADIIAQMKERLLTWYQETCDVVPQDEDSRFSDRFFIRLMSRHGQISEAFLSEQVFEKNRPLKEVLFELMQQRKGGS